MDDAMTPDEFHAANGSGDWRVLAEGAQATFRTGSLAASARFVAALAGVDGLEAHRPAIDVRAEGVTIRLLTRADDWYGITQRDLGLARAISSIAADQGLSADPSRAQSLLLVVGAPSGTAVLPFWRAALGYDPRPDSPDEDLVDPHDRDVSLWFEEMDQARGDGGGALHVGIFVAPEVAEARVAAALAAGGRLVRDDRAPMWWTLADAAGNEADIATTQGRS